MKRIIATLFTLALMVSTAYAHNGMEHVMGTVVSMTDNSITVSIADGKTSTVATTADTKYSRMDAAISMKDIKVGDHVVIHATEKNEKLTAETVKVGMRNMKGMHGGTDGMKMKHDQSKPAPPQVN